MTGVYNPKTFILHAASYRQAQGISSPGCSSLRKGLYDPKAFIIHAAWLRQAFAHCAIFPTAATRRCLDRVSVPV